MKTVSNIIFDTIMIIGLIRLLYLMIDGTFPHLGEWAGWITLIIFMVMLIAVITQNIWRHK